MAWLRRFFKAGYTIKKLVNDNDFFFFPQAFLSFHFTNTEPC